MSFILYLFLFIKLLSNSCNTLYNPFFVFLFPLYCISCPLWLVRYSVRILTEYNCTTKIVFCNLYCILTIIKTIYSHLYCISFLLLYFFSPLLYFLPFRAGCGSFTRRILDRSFRDRCHRWKTRNLRNQNRGEEKKRWAKRSVVKRGWEKRIE